MRVSLKWVLQLIGTILLLYYCMSKIDLDSVIIIISKSNLLILSVVILTFTIDLLSVSYRIKRLLNLYNIEIDFLTMFRLKLKSAFFALLFPILGEAYKIHGVNAFQGASYKKSTFVILLERIVFGFGLLVIAVPLWFISEVDVVPSIKTFGVLLLIVHILLLVFANRPESIRMILLKLTNTLKRLFVVKTDWLMTNYVEKRQCYNREIIVNLILVIGRHLTTMCTFYIIAASFMYPLDVGIMAFSCVVLTVMFMRFLPVSLGGIGMREAMSVTLFPQIGIPTEYAFAISVLISVFIVVIGLSGGIVYLFERLFEMRCA